MIIPFYTKSSRRPSGRTESVVISAPYSDISSHRKSASEGTGIWLFQNYVLKCVLEVIKPDFHLFGKARHKTSFTTVKDARGENYPSPFCSSLSQTNNRVLYLLIFLVASLFCGDAYFVCNIFS